MTITVLIADDAAMVRAGFAALLDAQEDLRVVGQVTDGREAVAQAARLRPDVILMDVRMPEMNGIEATERIGAPSFPSSPPPRILMLTTFDIDDYVHDALQAGASGFLLKDATPEELVHAVRVVAAGDALLSPGITRRMIAQFAARRPRPPRDSAQRSATAESTSAGTEILRSSSMPERMDKNSFFDGVIKVIVSPNRSDSDSCSCMVSPACRSSPARSEWFSLRMWRRLVVA